MMQSVAVRVENLVKHFEDVRAVDGISFELREGQIFSLLGPNGAGKSTTISMLSCLLRPDAGEAWVMGSSILSDQGGVKSAIGVVPQEVALYDDLSARENFAFWGKMYGLRGAELNRRIDEVLELIGLTDRQKGRLGKFSGGMKRRVNLGVALLHKPQVIIMDEPTVGIDPQSRRHILDGVLELNRQGMTVLYTTHYMEEAQELSDFVAIMDFGKVIAQGTHEELVKIVGQQDRIELEMSAAADALLEKWQALDGVTQVRPEEDGRVTVLAEDSNKALPHIFDAANTAGIRITGVEIHEPNLESVFLHLTGRALRD